MYRNNNNDSLLEFYKPSSLNELRCLVGEMAGEEEPVPWLYLVGESHEEQRVTGQSW